MDDIKFYAPVFIPTLCRYEHFKRCVESLAACTHSEKTELIVGLDYPPSDKYKGGYEKIKNYIPTITGFTKVTLIQHEKNLGGLENWYYLERYCNDHYPAYIGTEDDNEFSPCFLDFMNKALQKYEYDDNVTTVSGYSDAICYDQPGFNTYLCYANSAWGVGMWSHKENHIKSIITSNSYYIEKFLDAKIAYRFFKMFPARFGAIVSMLLQNKNWNDVKRSSYNYLSGKYQLRPVLSLCRNHGYDGSGIHCSINTSYLEQEISKEVVFNIESKPAPPESEACIKLYKSNGLPHSYIKTTYYKLLYLNNYLKFIHKFKK